MSGLRQSVHVPHSEQDRPPGYWHQRTLVGGTGVALRLVERDGRFVITDVLVRRAGGLSASDLGRVPLARWEAELNARGHAVGATLAVLTGGGEKTLQEIWADLDAGNDFADTMPPPDVEPAVPLGRPGGSGGEFYERVAKRYLELAAGGRPAARIAEENDVPVTTVHRWVREARRRGVMPPGRQGRVG